MGRKPNPLDMPERSGSAAGMEENMKKAVAEMLVLFLLNERDMYTGEILEELESLQKEIDEGLKTLKEML